MQDGGPGKSSYHFYSFKSSHHTYSDIQLYWPPEENFNKVWGHFLLREYFHYESHVCENEVCRSQTELLPE